MSLWDALNDENAGGGAALRHIPIQTASAPEAARRAAPHPPAPFPRRTGGRGGEVFLFLGRAAEPPAQKTIF